MKKDTKINFFLILGCIILAAALPQVVIAGFGIIGGVYLCIFVLGFSSFLLGGKL